MHGFNGEPGSFQWTVQHLINGINIKSKYQSFHISKHLTETHMKLHLLNIHSKKSVQKKMKHRKEKERNNKINLIMLLSKLRSSVLLSDT
jgi:hypothetical protein